MPISETSDRLLDEALEQTFPASDPVSVTANRSPEPGHDGAPPQDGKTGDGVAIKWLAVARVVHSSATARRSTSMTPHARPPKLAWTIDLLSCSAERGNRRCLWIGCTARFLCAEHHP